jgi:hypothetical protein
MNFGKDINAKKKNGSSPSQPFHRKQQCGLFKRQHRSGWGNTKIPSFKVIAYLSV